MNRWLAILLPMVLLVAMGYVGCRLDGAQKELAVERDKRIELEAEKAGLERALAQKPTEVVKLVEKIVPKEVVKLVEKHELIPVESVKIETKEVPVTLPCGPDGNAQTSVQVSGGFLLLTTPLGKPYWKKSLLVHMKGLQDPIDFSNDPGITVGFSEEIGKLIAGDTLKDTRWRFTPRPLKRWRTGLTCGVGAGWAVVSGRPDLTVACLWGLQM